MPRKKETAAWPGFEVAFEGEGLSPADVPARNLTALVEAVAAFFEKVAEERGVSVAPLRLLHVTEGSAAYAFRSPDVEAEAVMLTMETHARERGRNATEGVRWALERLFRSGRDFGAVRFCRFEGNKHLAPVHLAPPLEIEPAIFEEAREVYGVVVGVDAGVRRGATVKLRLDDGGTAVFDADLAMAQRAARLFTRPARAMVVYEIVGDRETEGEIDQLEESTRDDDALDRPLLAFDAARDALQGAGINVRASGLAARVG
jgi:hypothetical protein